MTSLYACDCVQLHTHVILCVCVGISGQNSFKGGRM